MSRFYVTTPIYYVNDVPHLGTAYTTIAADALRRFHRLLGDDTFMLTGTDEHGLKIERQSKEQGMSPKAFVDKMSEPFRAAWPKLDIEADRFIRTTEPEHQAFVQDLWKKVEANGDLYEGSYEDWYCVGCESFKTEKELLPGNVCAVHLKPIEKLREETYFFRLSKWQDRLLQYYAKHPNFIRPESRRNEVISFVEGGLRDLSVSRTSFSWGVPVPGNPKHIMYVWFDALANYASAVSGGKNSRFWPKHGESKSEVVHLMGKDILRFHAVYWPAFLLSAGYKEDELPSQIFAHGFLTVDGMKMSKSLRNAVDPLRLASELGADVLRYHLLRAIAFGQDGDFDHAALIERYNADLGKNLGNLLSRTLGLCTKLTEGKTSPMGPKTDLEHELIGGVLENLETARAAWVAIEPHRALEATWAISQLANQYVDRAAPWASAKNGDTERLHTTLAVLLEVLNILSIAMWPAMPKKSAEMRAQLGLPEVVPAAEKNGWPVEFAPRPGGEALFPKGPLFPTFDKDAEKALLQKLMPQIENPEPTADETAKASPRVERAPDTQPSPKLETVTYDHFAMTELKVGVVKSCERVPKKDKLLKLMVDLGEPELRQIVAGLALTFQPEQLVGKKVVVVANLLPRDFGKGLVSHGMLLATGPSESLTLATVDGDVPAGARLK